jgi:hypothetical protein
MSSGNDLQILVTRAVVTRRATPSLSHQIAGQDVCVGTATPMLASDLSVTEQSFILRPRHAARVSDGRLFNGPKPS